MGTKRRSDSGGCWGWLLVLLVAAFLLAGVVLLIQDNTRHDDAEPVPGAPGAINPSYSSALSMALQFFDIQKSGKLVESKISWRGDSALNDGSEAKLDLSKGMYDAGDHMKFGFPLAFTATVLSWAILEYGDQMAATKQLDSAQDSLKWITDYLINAHPEDNVLYIQVGDPDMDHRCWERPETMSEKRPLTQINASTPGADVAAETAAAMAAASLVFKDNSTYSSTLLKHSKQLFDFADKHRESYSVNIPKVSTYYKSTGYEDELLWAASWLYHATRDAAYLNYVTAENGKGFGNWGNPTWFSWDSKHAGTQVLLSRVSFFGGKGVSSSAISGLEEYRKTAEAVICGLMPDSPTATSSRTDSGLIWVSQWNALQHPVASAFLATVYSDYMLTSRTANVRCSGKTYKPSQIRKFAISQADYVLGNNPMNLSFVVGYGDRYPRFVHHRGASIPANATTNCKDGFKWLKSKEPDPHVAIGGLLGGPFLNETYIDSRNNSMQAEPTTYNNALLVGLLSGLVTTSSVVQSFGT
ncbi:hypothetical protein V2J09_013243 [Rumex salicifolius]